MRDTKYRNSLMGLQLNLEKRCLITGATKGLGEVLARRFWASGYNLCLVARSQSGLDSVKASLPQATKQQCDIRVCDLRDLAAVDLLASDLSDELPRLDVLINNAALHGPIGPLWGNDVMEWRSTFHVDFMAPVALCQLAVPLMAKSGGGSIVNLSGGGSTGPRPNFTAYGSAKSALVRFSETLAEETRSLGVRVNSIAPGAMKTAMLGEVLEKGAPASGQREYEIAQKVFAEGGASMDRVADLALFLASDASNGITGKLISAVWDNWEDWPAHLDELNNSDVYTLRRITGRDRGMAWGDK
jgi:NAD(P)-dependent dehydrogenase (short-subunit alcohol dehydrogenase family)